MGGGFAAASIEERFWPKVNREAGPDGCWPWLGAKLPTGYGHLWKAAPVHGPVYAHRVAYELLVGPIPAGLTLDHFRLNDGPRHAPCSKACVNPVHLEPVTSRVNTMRGNAPTAVNARKTHCPAGHPYVGGRRGCCLPCRREKWRLRALARPPRIKKTHCLRGHVYDGTRDGKWSTCGPCLAIASQKYRMRLKRGKATL